MKELILKPFFGKLSIPILIGIFLLTFIISFALFFALHEKQMFTEHGVTQIPTLSLTGSFSPENVIFTLGLHLAAAFSAYLFLAVYVCYEAKFDKMAGEVVDAKNSNLPFMCKANTKKKESLRKWNYHMLLTGLAACVFLILTGSIQMTKNEPVHTLMAFLMFACLIIHMICFYNNIQRYTGISQVRILMHRIAVIICIPLNVFCYGIAIIVVLICDSDSCWGFIVNMVPIVEFITVLGLALYIIQFQEDVQQTQLVIRVPVEPEFSKNPLGSALLEYESPQVPDMKH